MNDTKNDRLSHVGDNSKKKQRIQRKYMSCFEMIQVLVTNMTYTLKESKSEFLVKSVCLGWE